MHLLFPLIRFRSRWRGEDDGVFLSLDSSEEYCKPTRIGGYLGKKFSEMFSNNSAVVTQLPCCQEVIPLVRCDLFLMYSCCNFLGLKVSIGSILL